MKTPVNLVRSQSFHVITLVIVGLLAGVAPVIFIWSGVLSIGPLKMKMNSQTQARGGINGYFDLDNDSISEFIIFKNYPGEFPVVEVYKERKQLIEIIRPRGEWFKVRPSYCFGDYDNDNFEEIYLFSCSNDSILLNGYEVLGDDGHFLKNLYIDESVSLEGKSDLLLASVFFGDSDSDGFNELTFIVKAGFSLYPRRIYTYDFEEQILLKGENTAAGFSGFFPFDLTGEGKMEYIASASSYENFDINDTLDLYNDHNGWLLGYNNDPQSMRFAIEYSEKRTHINACIKLIGDEYYIIVKNYELNSNEQYLLKYDLSGKFLQKELMDLERNVKMLNLGMLEADRLGFSDGKNLYMFNDELKLIDVKKSIGLPASTTSEFRFVSTTGYFIFYSQDEVILFNQNLEEMGRVKIPGINTSSGVLSSVVSLNSDHSFVMALISKDHREYLIHVEERTFANAKLLINTMIFIGLYGFFYLVFRLQYFFYTRRLTSEHKIQSLQLQTVQNQLQPHFTFNVLNTIGSLIYKDEKETAYEYLNHFSDMLRSVLISGRVPRLMVQTYVENAVSHGLMHKKDDCRLIVKIEEDDTHIIVVIEDNGIGRFTSGKLQRNNIGHGNAILENYMEVYNKIHKTKFNFSVTDLFNDDGEPTDTRVTLGIPCDYSGNTKSI